ncbi:MAG: hypothetical protein RIS64_674 [Bacteroidota bacterium]|jgi:hypothetical protein
MLFRIGYIFGENDLVEDLSYAKYLINNELYKNDFYITHIANHVPNERYCFSIIASWFGNWNEQMFFLVHAILSFVLILGLSRLSDFLMVNKELKWLSLIILLLCLDNIHLGGNELYYNMLAPSYVAQVFGLWAILFFLAGKSHLTCILLFITTLFHPLIGAQLWTIIIGVLSMRYFKELIFLKNIINNLYHIVKSYQLILINIFCFIFSLIWILKIQSNYNVGTISNDKLFEIMQFRASHHYFPLYFPIKNVVILLPMMLFGYLFFRKTNKMIAHFYEIVFLGIIIYMIGVYFLKQPIVLSTQWFATTIWLEMFSVMSVIAYFQHGLLILFKKTTEKQIIVGLSGFAIIGIILMMPSFRLFKNKPYQFFCFKNQSSSRAIALHANILTDNKAVFLIPFENTDFKYWSERSVFVDYKSIAHQKAALLEWSERIQTIYGVSFEDYRKRLNINGLANQHWLAKTEKDFLNFKKEGVTHILTFKKQRLNLPIIFENKDWVIYFLN